MQEKDEVRGEIKYSMIPLCINNTYLFLTNVFSLSKGNQQEAASAAASIGGPSSAPEPISPSSAGNIMAQKQQPHQEKTDVVNKMKVFYGMIWYVGSLFGYFMME